MNDKDKRYRHHPQIDAQDAEDSTLVEGRNAVTELLRSGRAVDKLFVAEGAHGRVGEVLALAREAGVPISRCDRRKLDGMSHTGNHQGVIAQAAAQEYVSLDELFDRAAAKGEPPLFVVCDSIEDPHNLGAILRSAEAAGAHGVIIPKRRAVGMTAVVARASAGASAHIGVHKATNLAATLDALKARGVWVYGAESDGTADLYGYDFAGATALVIGSEGSGIGRLLREKCDVLVRIPMRGKINSLNASNAAAILLYEAVRRRTHNKGGGRNE